MDQTIFMWSLISCDTVKFCLKLWIGKSQYIFLGICCWDLTSIPRNSEQQGQKNHLNLKLWLEEASCDMLHAQSLACHGRREVVFL